MYFPTTTAHHLSSVPPLPQIPTEQVINLSSSPSKLFFCTLTRNGVALWRVRPPVVLAFLARTSTSLSEHGENEKAHWSPNGQKIVVQTSKSHLVLINIQYDNDPSHPHSYTHNHSYSQSSSSSTNNNNKHFLPGAGEALPLVGISLSFEGVIHVEGGVASTSLRKHGIIFSTANPGTIQRVPWPDTASPDEEDDNNNNVINNNREDNDNARGGEHKALYDHDVWILDDRAFPWLIESDVTITQFAFSRTTGTEAWITSDGRAYFVRLSNNNDNVGSQELFSTSDLGGTGDGEMGRRGTGAQNQTSPPEPHQPEHTHTYTPQWQGICIHDVEAPRRIQKQRVLYSENGEEILSYEVLRQAVRIAVNARFSVVAMGTRSGTVELVNFPSFSFFDGTGTGTGKGAIPKSQILQLPNNSSHYDHHARTGSVCAMEWSSDGYVLAVGWEKGWAIWSVGGRCLAYGFGGEYEVDEDRFRDSFMYGIQDLVWAPGNFELLVLTKPSQNASDGQLYIIPFAKSAVTEQQSPDNARYAFLQMDDRLLVYRGADQPDISVINPESDVWQHVKVPLEYLATNWPIRYSTISSDGRLIAVAGRRGLVHYSTNSGRWKTFSDIVQEQAFVVRGGLLWFHHILIAAVEVSKSYQIRLYSRDLELSSQNVLHREIILSPVVTLSLVDNSLLVYTADNALSHYLITPTNEGIQLQSCASISFTGVIAVPSVVRGLSWMIPNTHKQLGNPVDDLTVATVLMMVGGKLVLLRPRKSENKEMKYDMQILADRIEFCWIHLRGIGTLENSLWGYDGQGIRVWLNALNMESKSVAEYGMPYDSVRESVKIPLDFYPLSVLMDKGIIIGVEHDVAARISLPFVLFRHSTSTHLFLHHILKFHLEAGEVSEAVAFATHYEDLIYFAHALEILLHTVIESGDDISGTKEDIKDSLLSRVVEFLDHFDVALDVIVGCARKTEVARWRWLFDVVGSPKSLFETCLTSGLLKTAGSYLLVLHNLEQLDEGNEDAITLLRRAAEVKDWQLCREILRFLHSIDDTGLALRHALSQTNIYSSAESVYSNGREV